MPIDKSNSASIQTSAAQTPAPSPVQPPAEKITPAEEASTQTLKTLGERHWYLLAAAIAIVTANAYYIHPIIAYVADDFGVSDAMIGMVPAFNQIALALGIVLLLPLGDRLSNRRLAVAFTLGQFVCIVMMALGQPFWLFTTASTLLGFFTIVPYLLPTYLSKRVDPAKLGKATAILTAGVIFGILLARAGAGIIGELYGWRVIYYIAASLMLLASICLPRLMEDDAPQDEAPQDEGSKTYLSLLASLAAIVRNYPSILLAGLIQALNFGIFLDIWLGLGLYLVDDKMGYGADTVGVLTLITMISLFSTPRLGALADRIGPYRARTYFAIVQLAGVALFLAFGHSLWLLIIPILLTALVGPSIDVTSRMSFLTQPAGIRTRLMSVYIACMFIGGGLISWAATFAYDLYGWTGNAGLGLILSIIVLSLSVYSQKMQTRSGQ